MRTSHKNRRSGIFLAVMLLLVCEMASLAVLCGRVIGYTEAKFYNLVSITGELIETEMEIFHLSYDNLSGDTTVTGGMDNEDKLIAPGTSNVFEFTVYNPLDYTIDYTMTMEARVDGTEYQLPVNTRVWDYTNRYLLGSTDDMVDVMELNNVEDSASLGADRYAPYSLEWEWPFEWGDDGYDTMLGNLAVDGDITLTVVISIVAEYDEPIDPGPSNDPPPVTEPAPGTLPPPITTPAPGIEPAPGTTPATGDDITPGVVSEPSDVTVSEIVPEPEPDTDSKPNEPGPGLVKPPQTGDNSQLGFFLLTAAASLLGIFFLLFFDMRKDEDSEKKTK